MTHRDAPLSQLVLAAIKSDPLATPVQISRLVGCSATHVTLTARSAGIELPTTVRPHGGSKSITYRSWRAMKNRVLNSNAADYPYYGGRGIKVHEEWARDFEAFLRDMGPRPSRSHSIDRIDVGGHYEPGNCRWATASEQQRNKRDTRLVSFMGERMSVPDLITRCGLPAGLVRQRLRRGWSVERAVAP
jgi:hypothetical protein